MLIILIYLFYFELFLYLCYLLSSSDKSTRGGVSESQLLSEQALYQCPYNSLLGNYGKHHNCPRESSRHYLAATQIQQFCLHITDSSLLLAGEHAESTGSLQPVRLRAATICDTGKPSVLLVRLQAATASSLDFVALETHMQNPRAYTTLADKRLRQSEPVAILPVANISGRLRKRVSAADSFRVASRAI